MTIEQDLAELEPAIRRMAYGRVRGGMSHLFEDIAQEALIAAWQQLEANPEAPHSHAMQTARYRISKLLAGKPMTGEPRHPGRQDAHGFTQPLMATTEDGEEYLVAEPVVPDEYELLEATQADLAAVRALPDPGDQAIVLLRFWADLEWSAIAEILGRPPGTITRRWGTIIRPRLAQALEARDAQEAPESPGPLG